MLHVMAIIKMQPDHAAAVCAAMKEFAPKFRAEPGCLRYEVYQREDDAVIVTQETWTDKAAEAAHMSGANIAAVFAQIGSLLAAPPEIHHYSQLA